MKNESDFKTMFRKSIRYHKGYSIPLAAPMLSGIPDMYVIIPGFIPILLEAKWLGEIKREKFNRKIPFSEIQMNFIKHCHEVTSCAAMGLIGLKYKNEIYATLVEYGTPLFYTLDSSFLFDTANVVYKKCGSEMKHFNVAELFGQSKIPRMNWICTNKEPLLTSAWRPDRKLIGVESTPS